MSFNFWASPNAPLNPTGALLYTQDPLYISTHDQFLNKPLDLSYVTWIVFHAAINLQHIKFTYGVRVFDVKNIQVVSLLFLKFKLLYIYLHV